MLLLTIRSPLILRDVQVVAHTLYARARELRKHEIPKVGVLLRKVSSWMPKDEMKD